MGSVHRLALLQELVPLGEANRRRICSGGGAKIFSRFMARRSARSIACREVLLQVGEVVILGVAASNRRRGGSADLAAPSATIGSAEAGRGTVVVKLVRLRGEVLSDRQDHIGCGRG